MRSVKTFFYPLIAFAVLMVILLIVLLFMPTVSTTTTNMAANVTADHPTVSTILWGWSWWSQGAVVVGIIVFCVLGFGLWQIGKNWVKSRFGG